MNNIWLDLTTTYNWNRPPVGIVRVETEIARYMIGAADERIRYSVFNNETKALYELAHAEVAKMLSRQQNGKNAVQTSGGDTQQQRNPVVLGEGDVYITLGLDWDQKDYAYLYGLKKTNKFKVITFCYDLIPVLYPQYCVGDVAAKFAKYFVDLAWLSDHTFCISKCTENDFRSLLDSLGAPLPATEVIHLGCDINNINDSDVSKEIEIFKDKKYILFTSTIERRKNHEVIYKAICRLVSEGYEPPHVVFVGMQGWGVSDLMQDLKLDPRVAGRVTILNQLSDQELSLLYRNSLFTVFPSHYEGWGLPVSESLAYGKFCLASASSSLPEVGGDMLEYIDPYDVPKWAERIQYYYDNPHILAQKEERIKHNYSKPTWKAAGKAVHDVAIMLADRKTDDGLSSI